MRQLLQNWGNTRKPLPPMDNRRHYFDNSYMITDHPNWTNWDLIPSFERDLLINNLKTYTMTLTKFTTPEAAEIFSKTMGTDYLFYPCYCKTHSFQDINELFSVRGFAHDNWREDNPKRIPCDYLIMDKKAPNGYYITKSGMEYILRHSFLFKLTKYEKSCIEEYSC